MFAIGAIVPLIPYLLGFESLWVGLICGGVGLLIAGGVAAQFTGEAGLVGVAAAVGFRWHRDRRHLPSRHAHRHRFRPRERTGFELSLPTVTDSAWSVISSSAVSSASMPTR